ncbi:alpha/beta hydrolase family protein [Brachybacterium hainanense]|uniref:Alpha/beta hydrolase family protein n=1 Tax=Brachybacterium hainanense TaxID=1541174 RepID=A0ABV6RHI7_9MICO
MMRATSTNRMVTSRNPRSGWARAGAVGAICAGGAFLASAGALALGARVMARLPLVPSQSIRQRPDIPVRAVHADRVHLDETPETARGGYLSLRQQGGAVHWRLGPVSGRPTPTTVSRPVIGRDTDLDLEVGRASSNGFFWAGSPRTAHGLPLEEVEVASPVGPMPAWLVRSPDPAGTAGETSRTWAILVHGHGATRGEALRAIPLLHALGITTLTITYRNDTGASDSADRMHHLGVAEWEDAEAAIEHALAAGAQRLVLMGWSMGGGIVLRTSVLSAHREQIAALVLDSPAVDWRDILIYHATALKAPAPMKKLALWMMSSPAGARLVRLHEPIALDEMRPEFYARTLAHRTLLLHAMDDTTVPPGPSRRLADLRPDLVDFVPFPGASHTREWNRDPQRWERTVAAHLAEVLELGVDVDTLPLPVRAPGAPAQEGSIGLRL